MVRKIKEKNRGKILKTFKQTWKKFLLKDSRMRPKSCFNLEKTIPFKAKTASRIADKSFKIGLRLTTQKELSR
jgi:hypothetical protein